MRTLHINHILRPEAALPLVYLSFLGFSAASFKIDIIRRFLLTPGGAFNGPEVTSYLISILGIIILAASAIGVRKLRIQPNPGIVLILLSILAAITLYLALPLNPLLILAISIGFPLSLLVISKYKDTSSLAIVAFALAALFSLSILYRGIPILSAASRMDIAVDPSRALFHGFAVFAGALFIAYYEKRKAVPGILVLAGLGILSGFKSDAIAILASAGITGLLLGRIRLKEIAAAFGLIVVILTVVSTHIAGISYQSWGIPPSLYIFYRAGFTFSVFDRIVALSHPFGYLHGSALLDPSQMIASTAVLQYSNPHIITSTLLGPGMLDFGIIGIALTSIVIGGYLGLMYQIKKNAFHICLYAIALTHAFILIEVGLQLTSMLLYLSLLYLALAKNEATS